MRVPSPQNRAASTVSPLLRMYMRGRLPPLPGAIPAPVPAVP